MTAPRAAATTPADPSLPAQTTPPAFTPSSSPGTIAPFGSIPPPAVPPDAPAIGAADDDPPRESGLKPPLTILGGLAATLLAAANPC